MQLKFKFIVVLVSLTATACIKTRDSSFLRTTNIDKVRPYLFTHEKHQSSYSGSTWSIGEEYYSDETGSAFTVSPSTGDDDTWLLIKYQGTGDNNKNDLARIEYASAAIAKSYGIPTTAVMLATAGENNQLHHIMVKKLDFDGITAFSLEKFSAIQESQWETFQQQYEEVFLKVYQANGSFLVGAETADAVIWDEAKEIWRLRDPTILTGKDSFINYYKGIAAKYPDNDRIQAYRSAADDFFAADNNARSIFLQSNPQGGDGDDLVRFIPRAGLNINPALNGNPNPNIRRVMNRNPLLARGHAFYANEDANAVRNPFFNNNQINNHNRIPRRMVELASASTCKNPQDPD